MVSPGLPFAGDGRLQRSRLEHLNRFAPACWFLRLVAAKVSSRSMSCAMRTANGIWMMPLDGDAVEKQRFSGCDLAHFNICLAALF
jgi:hypothetical protein